MSLERVYRIQLYLKSEAKQTLIFLAVFLVHTTMVSFCFLIEGYLGFGLISFSEAGPSYIVQDSLELKYIPAFVSQASMPSF